MQPLVVAASHSCVVVVLLAGVLCSLSTGVDAFTTTPTISVTGQQGYHGSTSYSTAALESRHQQSYRKYQVQVSSSASDDDSSSTVSTTKIPIIINGQNIDLTPALEDHIYRRIGKTLEKLGTGSVTECDIVLSVNKNPKVKNGHRVEIVTNLKGTTIICKDESPDMYSSIDMAAHALNRKLKKYKDRRTKGWHGGATMGDDLRAALEDMDDTTFDSGPSVVADDDENEGWHDPEKPNVIKVNSFQLDKPISLDEAIFALDYVDHDFYVFRNEETDKISVVYKRHTGGVGLVEP